MSSLSVGFFVYEYLLDYLRSLVIICWASIILGVFLFFIDKKNIK